MTENTKAPSGAFFDQLSGQELFRTHRLIARRWQPADLDALERVYGDVDAMRWVGDGKPLSRSQCQQWLDVTANNYHQRGYGMSTLVLANGPERIVGFIGLVHPGGQAEAELKYALDRQYWGQGLASEGALGMIRYAAGELGLTTVIASLSPDNRASQRVLGKSGFGIERLETDEEGETLWMRWLANPAVGQ